MKQKRRSKCPFFFLPLYRPSGVPWQRLRVRFSDALLLLFTVSLLPRAFQPQLRRFCCTSATGLVIHSLWWDAEIPAAHTGSGAQCVYWWRDWVRLWGWITGCTHTHCQSDNKNCQFAVESNSIWGWVSCRSWGCVCVFRFMDIRACTDFFVHAIRIHIADLSWK